MSERIHPFPEIPRFPEDGGQPEEPKLEGAPSIAEESIFASVPELTRMANYAVEFDENNSAKKAQLIERASREIGADPERILHALDQVSLLEEAGAYASVGEFRKDLEQGIERYLVKEKLPNEEALEKWLAIYTTSALYAPLAERILARVVHRCQTTKSITELLYGLCLAGFRGNNPQTIEAVIKIIALETPIIPTDSNQAALYILANFDPDDEVLKKTMEVDSAYSYLRDTKYPEYKDRYDKKHEEILQTKFCDSRLKKLLEEHPDRMIQLMEHYDLPTEQGTIAEVQRDELQKQQFPFNLITDPGTLRQWLNDAIAADIEMRLGKFTRTIDFPNVSGPHVFESREELSEDVKEILKHLSTEGHLTEERFLRTLSYLLPPNFSQKELDALTERNQELRTDMIDNTQYLLSPRGDFVITSDELLEEMGFTGILYKMNPENKRQTIVTISVGSAFYRVALDEYFFLRDTNSGKTLHLPPDSAFLEHLILSHLRELRCTDRTHEMGPGKEGNGGSERRVTSRRPHRRKLPVGHHPTDEQIARTLEVYDVDIIRINRERAARGETQEITFVSEVDEVEIGNSKPVVSKADKATETLHALIAEQRL